MKINLNVIKKFCSHNKPFELRDLKQSASILKKEFVFPKSLKFNDPREYLIEELSKLTSKNGKARFNLEELKATINQVIPTSSRNIYGNPLADSSEIFSSTLRFAEIDRTATISDIANFARMRNSILSDFVHLEPRRQVLFKKLLEYTRGNPFLETIGGINKRRLSYYSTYSSDGRRIVAGVQDFIRYPDDKIKNLVKLLEFKTNHRITIDGKKLGEKFTFSADEITRLLQIKDLDVNTLLKIAKQYQIDGESLVILAETKGINLKAFANELKKLQSKSANKLFFRIDNEGYEANKFIMQQSELSKLDECFIKTYDNNINLLENQKVIMLDKSGKTAKLIGNHYETIQAARAYKSAPDDILLSKDIATLFEKREILDKEGNLLRTEYLKPSGIKDFYNWEAVMPDGTRKPIINVSKKNGVLTIVKDMESFDGTVTKSKFKQLENGSYAMTTSIKNGNETLSKRFVSHRLVSENEAISRVNNEIFRIKYSDTSINIFDIDGKVSFSIDLNSIIDKTMTADEVIKIRKLLQQCSVDELRIVKDKVKSIKLDDRYFHGSAAPSDGRIITCDDIFVFKHELGHINDLTNKNCYPGGVECDAEGLYSGAQSFLENYNMEFNNYLKGFNNTQRQYIDYFINPQSRAYSQQETAAELLATKGGETGTSNLGVRTIFLERFFPKTKSSLL